MLTMSVVLGMTNTRTAPMRLSPGGFVPTLLLAIGGGVGVLSPVCNGPLLYIWMVCRARLRGLRGNRMRARLRTNGNAGLRLNRGVRLALAVPATGLSWGAGSNATAVPTTLSHM